MTTSQIVEEIKQLFPDAGETQILLELNKAYRTFISKTRLLKTVISIDKDNDSGSFTLSGDEALLDLTEFNIESVDEIRFRDSTGTDLEENPCEFMIDGTTLRLKYSALLTDITTQAGFQTIRLNGVFKVPVDYLTISSTIDEKLDENMIDGLSAKVKIKFCEISKRPEMISYYTGLWREAILDGIRKGNEGSSNLQVNVRYN